MAEAAAHRSPCLPLSRALTLCPYRIPDNEHRRRVTVHQVLPAVESIPVPSGPLESVETASDPDPNWIRGDLVRAAQALLTAAQTVGSPATATAAEQRIPAAHVRSVLVVVQSALEHLE